MPRHDGETFCVSASEAAKQERDFLAKPWSPQAFLEGHPDQNTPVCCYFCFAEIALS